ALAGLARVERDLDNIAKARNYIEAALSIFESLRTKIAVNDLWASYLDSVQQHYEFYIDLLMRQHQLHPAGGYDRKALDATERARARGLLEILTEARADIRQGVDPNLLERERYLLQLLNTKYEMLIRLLSRKPSEQQAEEAKTEVEKLTSEFQQVQAEI